MIDPQGDPEIIQAHEKMRATLEDWIPKILAAQEPDGYLQTAFTLPRVDARGKIDPGPFAHWERRGDHEGYTAGYFLESAINHYLMTGKKRRPAVQRGEEAGGLLVRQPGPASQEGMVRRTPGDGAGAGALRPLRQRYGGRRQGHEVRRAREVPAGQSLQRGAQRSRAAGIRSEPPAGDPAVRGGGARRARHVQLLGHGGRRGGNARPRLPERGQIALGQHGQQEILRDRRRGQRRDLRGLRSELLAAKRAPIANRARVAARFSSSGR